jgi:hypothetical protein
VFVAPSADQFLSHFTFMTEVSGMRRTIAKSLATPSCCSHHELLCPLASHPRLALQEEGPKDLYESTKQNALMTAGELLRCCMGRAIPSVHSLLPAPPISAGT